MAKPFVFVIMPFHSDFDDTYKFGIKEVCLKPEVDCYCERVDEQLYEGKVIDRIFNQIEKADLIIADLTGRNPNVFFELGYASALKKEILMLQNKTAPSDSFFDKQHIRTQRYDPSDINHFQNELKANIIAIKNKMTYA
ncbi:MAG: nucleoside 2-deoxyribosyltransferase [Saprospiraceae bacterium]|nr:nucleoside 2-deoxyribosyltransferase [Candidatus Vicinibacter affinis]MBP7307093.1 nucleoside 2-deoxyribosyltransferase [Saprospiraceae bacterium]MBK6574501.1 nucleoside 2-deoxyribosyltransferase [Candidatus Vicinibacter affinis]MBK6823153.1 nucleoside 2-deoxyribosyltransferase [Candidatus Vicinibacter affinis]MBK7303494.1 nucleoside 2-deoxyribosyltransferase [Candidatus Vicinibacter affinis]